MSDATHPPSATDRDGIGLLRQALRSAGYEPDRMAVMLRSETGSLTPRPQDVQVIVRYLPERDRLADLMKLFLLRLEIPAARAADALAPLPLERAERIGVVARDGDVVRGTVRILPSGTLVFASDRELESDPDIPADHVMGVSQSSIFLASLTVREMVADVLDVGCGGGIQSVIAAQHAKRVVACDINARALAFTAFNAQLNGMTNVETREGSFFEPVKDERFDLIVSNPPFVISPASAIVFRDGGMRGDDVSRMVVREAAAHLRDGGLAFVLVSWGMPLGARWEQPLEAWVGDLGCDAWFLHQGSAVPIGYATTWNEPLQRADPAAFGRALDEWTRYYAELGYASLGYGAVVLRKRRAASHWTRADDLQGQREPLSGAQIAQLIAAEDYVRSRSDEQLLAARFTREPEHRLDQTLRAHDGAFAVESATLRLESGIRFSVPIDAFTAELFARLDGATTLTDAARAASARFANEGFSEADFATEACAVIRRLLSIGLVHVPKR
ncbi:MAG TPA: methyltransferase [Candidatus Limnocylindria bacterium]|nr:methyltransferase [Candidatus Limnocylindria bacterium]